MSNQCPVCSTTNSIGSLNCTSCGASLADQDTGLSHQLPRGALLKQNQYEILQLLGEGGFGITYKGRFLQNSAVVAIKELWPEKSVRQEKNIIWPSLITPEEKKQQIRKFKLEGYYQSKCNHPNVAKVYDWFEENNTAYIVMAFIPGKSLLKVLKDEGPLSENKAKKYFIQIAEALKAVHNNNFLHRDIKPENILIDNQDNAVLIDFGATREFIDGQSSDMSRIVTQGYAPLEQYSCRSRRFPATDFYALSASMYELLTGHLPADAIERTQQQDALVPPRQIRHELSSNIEKVILTGMRMKVEERFQTVEELIDALKGNFISPSHRQARELAQRGDLTSAIGAYEACIQNEPENIEALTELAIIATYVDDEVAKSVSIQLIQLDNNNGKAYGVLGLIHCRQADWAKALSYLQEAIQLAPYESWIHSNLAWAFAKTGKSSEAKSELAQAIRLDPNNTFSYGLKAWIEAKSQYFKTAISSAKPGLFKAKEGLYPQPDSFKRWVYPILLISLEKISSNDLERCSHEFIEEFPNDAFAWGFIGWKQASQGLWKEALYNFRQAEKESTNQHLSWMFRNLWIVSEHVCDLSSLIQMYKSQYKEFPKDPFLLFRLSTLLGRKKQWKEAYETIIQALKLKPDYAEAYHNHAWILLNCLTDNQSLEDANSCQDIIESYSKAILLYRKQGKIEMVKNIETAFKSVNISF